MRAGFQRGSTPGSDVFLARALTSSSTTPTRTAILREPSFKNRGARTTSIALLRRPSKVTRRTCKHWQFGNKFYKKQRPSADCMAQR